MYSLNFVVLNEMIEITKTNDESIDVLELTHQTMNKSIRKMNLFLGNLSQSEMHRYLYTYTQRSTMIFFGTFMSMGMI